MVVAWFGTNHGCRRVHVLPGVEYQTGATTSPDTWSVAGLRADTAHLITQIDGSPQYGGTPDDCQYSNLLYQLRNMGFSRSCFIR